MPRFTTDSGETVDISINASQANTRERPLDVDPRFRDHNAEARGRGAKVLNQREARVKVYRGNSMSSVPVSQAAFMLGQGFTSEPTKPPTPLPFICGVETLEGGICQKALRTDRDRVNHIRAAHGDVAPWILSDEDMLKARGKVVIPRASYGEDPRVAVLEGKVNELLELLRKANTPVAQTIAAELIEDLQVAETGADEFADEFTDTPATDNGVELVDFATPVHTCKPRGRFGKIIDGCPACEVKKREKHVDEN